jgi:hypothetical protein
VITPGHFPGTYRWSKIQEVPTPAAKNSICRHPGVRFTPESGHQTA